MRQCRRGHWPDIGKFRGQLKHPIMLVEFGLHLLRLWQARGSVSALQVKVGSSHKRLERYDMD